jgi:Cu(I)/Ag(I) efflux system membrane protein CusA/SilA
MIDGMISLTLLTLIVIPAVYGLVKGWRISRMELMQTRLHENA